MSDSLANLGINVNTQSVKDALAALDKLAIKAGEVDKKVSNIGSGSSGGGGGSGGANSTFAAQTARIRQMEAAARQYENTVRKINSTNISGAVRSDYIDKATNSLRSYQSILATMGSTSKDVVLAQSQWARSLNEINSGLSSNTKLIQQRATAEKSAVTVTNNAAQSQLANLKAIEAAQSRVNALNLRANRQGGDITSSVIGANNSALAKYISTVNQYGSSSAQAIKANGDFTRSLQLSSSQLAAKSGLLTAISEKARVFSAAFGAANASLGGFSRVLFSTQAALSSLVGALGLREIAQTLMAFERFSNTLRATSGSAGDFNNNLQFLFNTADRVGFSVGEVGNAFARFATATRGAGFDINQTRASFASLTEASRNFGLSSADTTGIVRAFEQSLSKGKFMAEEVRLQLGDRLPVAMAALQAAVNRVDGSQQDLNKRFEEGSLDVQRYFIPFVQELTRMSGGADALTRSSNSIAASLGRLGTEFTRASIAFGEGGFTAGLISATTALTQFLEYARQTETLSTLGSAFKALGENVDLLAGAIAGLVAAAGLRLLIGWLVSLFTQVTPLGRVLSVLTIGLTALGGAVAYLARVSSSSDEVRRFTAALSTVGSTVNKVSGDIENFQTAVSRGTPAIDSSVNATELLIAANLRLGNSYEQAIINVGRLRVAEAERASAAAREAVNTATTEYGNFIRTFIGAGQVSNNLAEQQNAALLSRRTNPRYASMAPGTTPAEQMVASLTQTQAVINDVTAGTSSIEQAIARIQNIFSNRDIPAYIEDILKKLSEIGNSTDFARMTTQLEGARRAVEGLDNQIKGLKETASGGVSLYLNLSANQDGFEGGRPVTSFTNSRSGQLDTATAGAIRGNSTPAGIVSALRNNADLNNDVTIGPLLRGRDNTAIVRRLQGMARQRDGEGNLTGPLNTILPTSMSEIRNRVFANDAPSGAQNAVEEFMRDLRLQVDAAGAADGAATAYATTLRRLADAATKSGSAVSIAALEDEARALVTQRLNKELDKYIAQTTKETSATNRTATAFARSEQAGRDMEVQVRAEAEARKYGIDGTEQYTLALQKLLPVMQNAEKAQRNLAASRQISQGRDEIEILEAEGRLVTANTQEREKQLAVIRATQQTRGSDPELIRQAQEVAVRQVELRQNNEFLTNSWNELASVGSQAFERIGSAITEAFANGKLEALSFKNIAKAVMSEVVQAVLKLAVINPILNTLFGGTRGSVGGIISAIGGGGSGLTGLGSLGLGGVKEIVNSNGGSLSDATSLGGRTLSLQTIGSYGNLAKAFTVPGQQANTGFSLLDNTLNTSLVSPTVVPIGGTYNATAATGMVDIVGSAETGYQLVNMGATPGMTLAQGVGGAAGILGGAYGIYSGIQKGGVGGAVGVAGGLAGIAGGAGVIAGGLGAGTAAAAAAGGIMGSGAMAGLAAFGPYGMIAAAVLAIVSALLPGEKPSGKGQEARMDFISGNMSFNGLTGNRFSQGNKDQATQAVQSISNLANQISGQLGGLRIKGEAAVGVTSSRGDGAGTLYLDISGQKAQFQNTEEGAKELSAKATEFLLNEFTKVATGDFKGILNASGGNLDTLGQNLEFYNGIYKSFQGSEYDVSAFGKSMRAFQEQMNSTRATFDGYIDKSASLGLATDKIVAARDKEMASMEKQKAEMEKQRLTQIENSKTTLKIRGINAGLETGDYSDIYTALQGMNAQVGELNRKKEVEDFRQSLEDLGVAAEETTKWVEYLTKIQDAERVSAEAEAARIRKRDTETVRNELLTRAGAVGLTDPAEAQRLTWLTQSADELVNLQNTLKTLGIGAAETAYYVDLLTKVQKAEFEASKSQINEATREQARQAAGSMFAGLADYARSLSYGDSSALSVQAQYEQAKSSFDSLSATALTGDAKSLNQLQSYAEQLLTSGRAMFGSGTGYAELFNKVVGTLDGVSNLDTEVVTQSFIALNTQTQTETLVEQFQELKTAVIGVQTAIQQMASAPTRATG